MRSGRKRSGRRNGCRCWGRSISRFSSCFGFRIRDRLRFRIVCFIRITGRRFVRGFNRLSRFVFRFSGGIRGRRADDVGSGNHERRGGIRDGVSGIRRTGCGFINVKRLNNNDRSRCRLRHHITDINVFVRGDPYIVTLLDGGEHISAVGFVKNHRKLPDAQIVILGQRLGDGACNAAAVGIAQGNAGYVLGSRHIEKALVSDGTVRGDTGDGLDLRRLFGRTDEPAQAGHGAFDAGFDVVQTADDTAVAFRQQEIESCDQQDQYQNHDQDDARKHRETFRLILIGRIIRNGPALVGILSTGCGTGITGSFPRGRTLSGPAGGTFIGITVE